MGPRVLSLVGFSLLSLLAACSDEGGRAPSASDETSVPIQATAVPAATESVLLPENPLAAGNADDVETLRKRLDELDLRTAQLRATVKERGLGADRELGETLGELATYREEAGTLLTDLERRTGGAFTALEEELELMITDLEQTLDAIARELEIELAPVELEASLAPTSGDAAGEQDDDRPDPEQD